MTMRSPKMEQKYQDAKVAGTLMPLGDEPSIPGFPEFAFWKVIENRFPHDRHHVHHVLAVLKRDCPVKKVSQHELAELWYELLPWADKFYDVLKLNLSSMRSINGTVHIHLCTLKPEFK